MHEADAPSRAGQRKHARTFASTKRQCSSKSLTSPYTNTASCRPKSAISDSSLALYEDSIRPTMLYSQRLRSTGEPATALMTASIKTSSLEGKPDLHTKNLPKKRQWPSEITDFNPYLLNERFP